VARAWLVLGSLTAGTAPANIEVILDIAGSARGVNATFNRVLYTVRGRSPMDINPINCDSGNGNRARRLEAVDKLLGMLDVDAAAAYLCVKPGYVRRLVRERRIPFRKVGKYLRFDRAELDGWLEAHRFWDELQAQHRSE
jgi:excisionase family DNA binding protein